MFIKYVQFLLILAATSLWAHKIPVSTDAPYSSEEVLLSSENDTIAFSNGVILFSCVFLSYGNMENNEYCHAIGFQSPEGKIAYKNSSGMNTSKYRGIPLTDSLFRIGEGRYSRTTGNPDTIWSFATNIPTATYSTDSLFIKTDTSKKLSQINGKMLFSHEFIPQGGLQCFKDLPYSNYNGILYFLPASHQSSNMKFQVVSFTKGADSMVYTPDCKQVSFNGIRIRWATDSLGNGSFKGMTGIQRPAQNDYSKIIKKKSSFLRINGSRENSADHSDELFDAQGKPFSQPLGKGVYFRP
jgi:hypothetical protein